MSINSIFESLQQGLSGGASRSMVFPADKDFASTLTLGKIIKGKVMRHYEGNRYGIDFNGQEKVVDTTFPLRNGDVIYARVMGVDEKVHLQRVTGDPEAGRAHTSARDRWDQGLAALENRDAIQQMFDRYQARLTSRDHQLLQKLQAVLGGGRRVAASALILSKLGVTLEPGLIKAIHRVLQDLPADRKMDAAHNSTISLPSSPAQSGDGVIEGLAVMLSRLSEKGPAGTLADTALGDGDPAAGDIPWSGAGLSDSRTGQEDRREQLEWFLGQWLLNAQTNGAVAHRFLRIPMWFNGELVEVTLALFAQKGADPEEKDREDNTLRYRKIVFALDTEGLGHVEVKAKLANRHVRIEVVAEHADTAEYLGSKGILLKAALASYGWQVDEIGYGTRPDPRGPVHAVVEHFIAQDSLNRLF